MQGMARVNNASGDGDKNNGRKVTAVPTYYGSHFLLSYILPKDIEIVPVLMYIIMKDEG